MKQRNRASASGLFLLELIVAILFFAIASAFSVQIFVKAHKLNEQSQISNWAVNECAGFAEVLRSSDSTKETDAVISRLYPDSTSDTDRLYIYYDEDFSPCGEEVAEYKISIEAQGKSSTTAGIITATDAEDQETYFELRPKRVHSGEGKEES